MLSLAAAFGLMAVLATRVMAAQGGTTTVALERFSLPVSNLSHVKGAQLTDKVEPSRQIKLTLALPLRNQDELKTMLHGIYDPKDPLFHHYLTPTQFGTEFGPTISDLQAVEKFVTSHGMTVNSISKSRDLVKITGTDAQIESAFDVTLNDFTAPDGYVYHAPDREPTITADVADKIVAVIGIDTGARAHSFIHKVSSQAQSAVWPDYAQPLNLYFSGADGLTPNNIRSVYDLPAPSTGYNGAGETLAVVELDTYVASNITTYETMFNISNIPLTNVGVDGFVTTQTPGGGEPEVELDIELQAAVSPKAAGIYVYENQNTSQALLDIYQQIADDDIANQISTSWGLAEDVDSLADAQAADVIFEQMAIQGQSFFAAAGDAGAYDDQEFFGAAGSLSTDNPASVPYATGVGGTFLNDTRVEKWVSESAWGDPEDTGRGPFGSGSGGGVSQNWQIPDYQVGAFTTAANPQGSTTMRNVPDVSLFGDYDEGGYETYIQGAWAAYNGTSAAAPLWASFTALVNQQLAIDGALPIGFMNPSIYKIADNSTQYANDFHDVIGGNNLYYNAVAGYDNASGWGSFDGSNLLTDLVDLFAAATTTTLTAAPNPSSTGEAVTLLATVTSANATPTGNVTFSAGGMSIGTAALVNGNATLTTTTLALGSDSVTAAFTGARGFASSSSAAVTETVTTTPNLPAPTFSVPAGPYVNPQSVAIADAQPGVAIYYTTDGSLPTTSSNLYSTPIQVQGIETVNAIADLSGYNDSPVATATYIIDQTVPSPTISPAGGPFSNSVTVTLADTMPGASIYFTTDNTTPIATPAELYSAPITLSATTNLQVIAVSQGYNDSPVVSAPFTLVSAVPTPTISPNGGAFFGTQTVTMADALSGSVIYYTLDGTTPTIGSLQYTAPITISASYTVTAVAVVGGSGLNSAAASANFYDVTSLPNPAVTPNGGTYTSPQTVTMSDSLPVVGGQPIPLSNVSIYYTLDGTTPTPTSLSTLYSPNSPLVISKNTTLKALAYVSNLPDSLITQCDFYFGTPNAVPQPTMNPPAGAYGVSQVVTITDALAGATIYYTTDGTTPTTASNLYTAPLTVSSTETISAIATYPNEAASSPVVQAYDISLVVPAPVINPPSGSFSGSTTVSLTDSLAGASIYYTVDGSVPSINSTLYTAPFNVTTSETITAFATETGYANSAPSTVMYTIVAATAAPTISPAGGTFTGPQTVTLSAATGASIYYTTDGSAPTTASMLYSGPIMVTSTETITAVAQAPNLGLSATVSATYVISPIVPAPVLSPDGGTYDTSQTVTIADGQVGATIYYSTNANAATGSPTWMQYTGPVTVSSSETLSAYAAQVGYQNSPLTSAAFTLNLPTISTLGAGLQFFSLPYGYPGVSLDSLFGYTGVKLAVYINGAYVTTPTAPTDDIVLGQGYWVRNPQTVNVTLPGTAATTTGSYDISLQSGWNMIGDPFNAQIPLSSLTFAGGSETFSQATGGSNPIVGGTFWSYDASNSQYAAATQLTPLYAYWVYAYSPTDIEVPAP